MINHPADCVGTPPLDEELYSATVRSKFPSIGGVGDTGPRATCRVGGWDGVVRECEIGYLISCHSREGGNRVY